MKIMIMVVVVVVVLSIAYVLNLSYILQLGPWCMAIVEMNSSLFCIY
jgi:hypothetical protein